MGDLQDDVQPDPSDLFDKIRPFVLRLKVTPTDADCDEGGTGTCFVIGRRAITGELIAVTAKHLLPNNSPANWEIKRYDQQGRVDYQAIYPSKPSDDTYSSHPTKDIGYFLIHPSFSKYFDQSNEKLPATIEFRKAAGEGSRVSWCGYPDQVEQYLNRPHLCYFGGSVSASIIGENDGSGSYLLDGHVANGVSGGPVWFWCKENRRLEVIGVITEYCAVESDSRIQVPGFCVVQWINAFVHHLAWLNRMASLPADHPEKIGKRPMKFPYQR